MTTRDDPAWVHTPRQARSQETLERFLNATTDLLHERPFEEITVADIVRRADRTVGSFYARFDDKYAVLYELMEQVYGRIASLVRAFCDPVRWEGQTLGDFIVESVHLNVHAYRRKSALFRASLCAAASDDRFRTRRAEIMGLCAELQKAFVLSRADEASCDDAARASDQMFELVSTTLDHELLFGRFTTTSPTDDVALVADLSNRCFALFGLRNVVAD